VDEDFYPECGMRWAFVVQVKKISESAEDQLQGSVEEVDTGRQILFRSDTELIQFLRERTSELNLREKGRPK